MVSSTSNPKLKGWRIWFIACGLVILGFFSASGSILMLFIIKTCAILPKPAQHVNRFLRVFCPFYPGIDDAGQKR